MIIRSGTRKEQISPSFLQVVTRRGNEMVVIIFVMVLTVMPIARLPTVVEWLDSVEQS